MLASVVDFLGPGFSTLFGFLCAAGGGVMGKKKMRKNCVSFSLWHLKIARERKVLRDFIMVSSLESQSIIFIIMKHRNNEGWRQVCNSKSMSSETMAKKEMSVSTTP